MTLPDGLELRAATSEDVEQAARLLEQRLEPEDAEDLRLIVADPDEGLEAVGVVVDGDRVVSMVALLRETVVIEGVSVPTGQLELVATDPEYERRGLVRALIEWAHDRSSARGDLLQVLIGIPYFYRQFGYGYALPIPMVRRLTQIPEPAPGVTVRRAVTADIPTMAALEDRVQSSADIAMPHSMACWRWLVERSGTSQWIAERAGNAVATARVTPPDEGPIIGELAALDDESARALVAHIAHEGAAYVMERPLSTVHRALAAHLEPIHDRAAHEEWYYGRIPALGPLLKHIEPVLVERLTAAGLGGRRHDVLLSTWRSHVRFTIDDDGVSRVVEGGPEQRPISKGGSAVPPDALPRLVLGPGGALGVEAAWPDCMLGAQRELMAALFPPVTADLLSFYLPV